MTAAAVLVLRFWQQLGVEPSPACLLRRCMPGLPQYEAPNWRGKIASIGWEIDRFFTKPLRGQPPFNFVQFTAPYRAVRTESVHFTARDVLAMQHMTQEAQRVETPHTIRL
jgi:hypothetical protein